MSPRIDVSKQRKYTKRETEIHELLVEGYSNAKIAAMLDISEKTVKYHIYSIFRLSDCESRLEYVVKFYKKEL